MSYLLLLPREILIFIGTYLQPQDIYNLQITYEITYSTAELNYYSNLFRLPYVDALWKLVEYEKYTDEALFKDAVINRDKRMISLTLPAKHKCSDIMFILQSNMGYSFKYDVVADYMAKHGFNECMLSHALEGSHEKLVLHVLKLRPSPPRCTKETNSKYRRLAVSKLRPSPPRCTKETNSKYRRLAVSKNYVGVVKLLLNYDVTIYDLIITTMFSAGLLGMSLLLLPMINTALNSIMATAARSGKVRSTYVWLVWNALSSYRCSYY